MHTTTKLLGFRHRGTKTLCPRPPSDAKKQSKPLQNANGSGAPPTRGGGDVDSIAKTSRLSASAPEFVPSGMSQYEVSADFNLTADTVDLFPFLKYIFSVISSLGPSFLQRRRRLLRRANPGRHRLRRPRSPQFLTWLL